MTDNKRLIEEAREMREGMYSPMPDERIATILETNSHGLASTHDVFDLCKEVQAQRVEIEAAEKREERLRFALDAVCHTELDRAYRDDAFERFDVAAHPNEGGE